jgi:cellulose synthase/poly-beta-1,6-N-acetylglucosamine synthase-like glycosyltransferase
MPLLKPPNSGITISVIIPVYKGGQKFVLCLEALSKALLPPHEIIVVADGGIAHIPSIAKEMNITILEIARRRGPARARNLGAQAAKEDILFFIDADVLIKPDSIHKVLEIFKQNPDLTAVFGSYDDAPSEQNFLSQYRNLLHHYVHQTGQEDASTFWGACGAIRREVFLALGGFDEKLYRQPAIEDIELGYRLKKAGYKIRLLKTLQIKHLKRWGVFSMLKTDFFQRALPWTELILRDRKFVNDLNLDTSSRMSVMLIFGLLTTMITAAWHPAFIIAAALFIILLVGLNAPLYRFFRRERSSWFALITVPWHWLYYFYSGLAFVIGVIPHFLTKNKLILLAK